MPENRTKLIHWGLFLLLLFSFVYVHQKRFNSATPASRLDLLHAIFTHGTLRIDAYDNTPDKAVFEGHYYSDKAPGTVTLALPFFALAAGALSLAGIPLESDTGWLVTSWAGCVGSNALAAALGGVALFAFLSRFVRPRWALVTTLAIFLGSMPLPYSTLMFSHSLVVGCVAIALWAIAKTMTTTENAEHTESSAFPIPRSADVPVRSNALPPTASETTQAAPGNPPSDPSPFRVFSVFRGWLSHSRWSLLAGHVCGWALASEYTAGIVVAGLLFWLISSGWRRAIPFCLGALPPLLLIPLYSWACFGNPFILPYSLQASFPAMKEGLYAIKWPDAETAYNLLFSPMRGLFFWSPFLLIAAIGYRNLVETSRKLFWLTYAVPVLQVLIISGRVWDWQAGFSFSARYLAPILPLLALPCALGVRRFPKIGIALALYSVAITILATLTDICSSYSDFNPLLDLNLPLLRKGDFSPTLGQVLGLPPFAAVVLYCAVIAVGTFWLWRRVSGLPSSERRQGAAGV